MLQPHLNFSSMYFVSINIMKNKARDFRSERKSVLKFLNWNKPRDYSIVIMMIFIISSSFIMVVERLD